MSEAKQSAEKKCADIISSAKSDAENVVKEAYAEVDKMYEDAKTKAETRCKTVYSSAEDLKDKAVDTVSYVLF